MSMHDGVPTEIERDDSPPLPRRILDLIAYDMKRHVRARKGLMPLRKRPKRLHKKLAKRGFQASARGALWICDKPGYGTRGTEFDFLKVE